MGGNLPNVSDRGVKCWNVFFQHYIVTQITEENISNNFKIYFGQAVWQRDGDFSYIWKTKSMFEEREKPSIHLVPLGPGKIRRWIERPK